MPSRRPSRAIARDWTKLVPEHSAGRLTGTSVGGSVVPRRRQKREHFMNDRLDPSEFDRLGFRPYERFRPDVPEGTQGWGEGGVAGGADGRGGGVIAGVGRPDR
jgi:hypothetical protein